MRSSLSRPDRYVPLRSVDHPHSTRYHRRGVEAEPREEALPEEGEYAAPTSAPGTGAYRARGLTKSACELILIDMQTWAEFRNELRHAVEAFVDGDAGPYKACWSDHDDCTLFGAFGGVVRGGAAIAERLEWAASQYTAVGTRASRC